jgi:tocopherol O-methyltransferase
MRTPRRSRSRPAPPGGASPERPCAPERPPKELIRRFYDTGSPYYAEMWGEHIHDGYYITGRETRGEAQENLVKYLADAARVKAGDRVLDVGCGIGGSSVWLATNIGAATVGITISPVQVDMARKTAAARRADCTFLLMDADEMDFDDEFDVIWAVAVGTHLADQGRFIEKATRFLKPQGRFVVFDWMLGECTAGVPRDRSIEDVCRGMLLASLHSLSEYRLWFTGLGYRIVSEEDVTGFTARTWDDALSLVRRPVVWKFLAGLGMEDINHGLAFVRGLGAMKTSMEQKRLVAGAIVGERP